MLYWVQLANGENSSYTYGELEETGSIALDTNILEQSFVHIPYSLFTKLVSQLPGNDPFVTTLRKCCDLAAVGNKVGLNWQLFEDFHNNVEAMREMLLARRLSDDDNYIQINKFYGIESNAHGLSSVKNGLEFKLRENCSVKSLRHRFPTQTLKPFVEDIEGTNPKLDFVKNCAGAIFDSFTYRQSCESELMLVCSQQKHYLVESVSKEIILDEWNKIDESIGEDINKMLVIVATRIEGNPADFDLPSGVILLTGEAMQRFYGKVLCTHAQLLTSVSKVFVNTANDAQ
jgi:hypothetical protein